LKGKGSKVFFHSKNALGKKRNARAPRCWKADWGRRIQTRANNHAAYSFLVGFEKTVSAEYRKRK